MQYINRPAEQPPGVIHETFTSRLYRHEIGYNVYLPPDYAQGGTAYPVAYHLHGWQGNESSEIWTLQRVVAGRRAITVFPNSSPVIEAHENLPVEAMVTGELMPHIDATYRTDTARAARSVSGFSMGGGAALYWAAKRPELFASVTAYAGTYHHYYPKDYRGVEEPREKAAELYESMMAGADRFDETNILYWIAQNADGIRGKLHIVLRIGSEDPLICDNEILHMHLDSLGIPHEYEVLDGIGHVLDGIV